MTNLMTIQTAQVHIPHLYKNLPRRMPRKRSITLQTVSMSLCFCYMSTLFSSHIFYILQLVVTPAAKPKPAAKPQPKPEPLYKTAQEFNNDDDSDSDLPPCLVSDSSSGGESSDDDEGGRPNHIPDLSKVNFPPRPEPTATAAAKATPTPTPTPTSTPYETKKATQASKQAQKKKAAKERQKLKKKQRDEEAKRKLMEEERLRVQAEHRRVQEERALTKKKLKSALRIQTVFRRYRVFLQYGAELEARRKTLKSFKSSWGFITRILKRKPNDSGAPEKFSWFEEKNRYDMVLYASEMTVGDEDAALSDQQKLFQNVTTDEFRKTSTSSSDESGASEEKSGHQEKDTKFDLAGDFINTQARELSLDELGISEKTESEILDPYVSESTQSVDTAAAVLNVEFTETVMKWLQNADSRYRIMFSDRVERLAQGERSYMLCKRLKGCTSPVFETKLDSAQRILWTQLLRKNENPSIIVSSATYLYMIYLCAIL